MQERKAVLHGEVVLLRGNTRALEQRVRYIDADLNRQWTIENARTAALEKQGIPEVSELREQSEVLAIVKEVVSRARGEIYFLDLHTTSAHGQPFATVGDTLRNRRFALTFPFTVVLGLEEQIDGTTLEYMNNLGAITMGVEAGQHEAITSVDHHEAVIGTHLHRRDPLNENVLIINTRVARILPLQVFHLLGFRRLRWTDKFLVVSRRSYDLVGPTKISFLAN
jgi:hypothetical protein